MSVVEEDTNRENKRSAASSSKGLFVLGELGESKDKKGPSVSTSTSTSTSALSRSDNGRIISSALLASGEELANKERNIDKDNILLDLLVRIGS